MGWKEARAWLNSSVRNHIRSEALRGGDRSSNLIVEILYSKGAKSVEVWTFDTTIETGSLKVKLPDNRVQAAWLFVGVGELLSVRAVEPVEGELDTVIIRL